MSHTLIDAEGSITVKDLSLLYVVLSTSVRQRSSWEGTDQSEWPSEENGIVVNTCVVDQEFVGKAPDDDFGSVPELLEKRPHNIMLRYTPLAQINHPLPAACRGDPQPPLP